jgi:hypothetical protein
MNTGPVTDNTVYVAGTNVRSGLISVGNGLFLLSVCIFICTNMATCHLREAARDIADAIKSPTPKETTDGK